MKVNSDPPVWRLYNKSANVYIWTAKKRDVDSLVRTKKWRNQGVAFRLGK